MLRTCPSFPSVAGGSGRGIPIEDCAASRFDVQGAEVGGPGRRCGATGPSLMGIEAGCTGALAKLKAYMLRELDAFVARQPLVELDMYVGDGSITSAGERRSVRDAIVEASRDIDDVVDVDLELPIGRDKGELLASDVTLAREIASRLGRRFGVIKRVVSKLGIDFAAGRRRGRFGKRMRLRRLRACARRTRRLRRLRRAGRRLPAIFRSGIPPAAAYRRRSTHDGGLERGCCHGVGSSQCPAPRSSSLRLRSNTSVAGFQQTEVGMNMCLP